MIFNTWSFGVFALAVFALGIALPARAKPAFILVAGIVFYAFSIPAYLALIAAIAAVTYVCVTALEKPGRSRAVRRRIFVGGTVAVASVLVFFKYAKLLDSTIDAVAKHNLLPVPHVVVPLAISFFTFEFVHVLVDAYRGDLGPVSPLKFAVFAMFFPTLVAGPIKRYQSFAPQLDRLETPDARRSALFVYRIALGLTKKIVLADSFNVLTAPLGAPGPPFGRLDYAVALAAFTGKVYFDFSGYSDIAIGLSGLLGISIPENFDRPLRAMSIAEFWNRWHMSLSTWIRDYIFIPLGGSRRPAPLVALNLMLAMAISGLWHGAAWTFLLWGLWHGAGLAVHRTYARTFVPRVAFLRRGGRAVRLANLALTHAFLMSGWLLFATSSLADGELALRGLLFGAG